MLGWFKKKFRKRPAEAEQLPADIDEQTVVSAEEGSLSESEDGLTGLYEEKTPAVSLEEKVLIEEVAVFDECEGEGEGAAVGDQAGETARSLVADADDPAVVSRPGGEIPEPEEIRPEQSATAEPSLLSGEAVDTEKIIAPVADDAADDPDPSEIEPVVIQTEHLTEDEFEPLPEAVADSLITGVENVDASADQAETDAEEADNRSEPEQPITAEETAEAEELTADLPGDVEAVSSQAVEGAAETGTGKTQKVQTRKSLFQRLQERLGKTRDAFVYQLDRLFLGKKEIDQELFEQLEELLITSDLGVGTTLDLLDIARKKVKRDQLRDPQALKSIIRDQILAYIEASEQPAELVMPEEGPFVIMVVGVNGVGKTTTIGKLAAKFIRSGQTVLLVAADTFRAAAINQLKIWGDRVGAEVTARNPGADPSSVVFDGLEYGIARDFDVIIIDTAGRLHTSVNLMEELKKIRRVIDKKLPGAPHEVMLVLDATTGQNGVSQAKLFHETVGISGLALTKLDGTAKGGIIANVCREMKIPVRFIGIGEQMNDLRDFDAR
ncbi:MAG: signal recognition particle-docking protein FtsY, partial [Desulfobulbus sp.]|nr:signal recognition particle-docking protein FtsY [Desulfobulbus sp.]